MYLPPHFEESRPEALDGLMRRHPLAALVTFGPEGLTADHIPLLAGPAGTLRGHVARANPLWRAADGAEVLAIFQGPGHYVSPGWYPTKREDGKAVPTWNYLVVHAHGRLRAHDDPAWVRGLLDALTAEHEAAFPAPWKPADAPGDYLEGRIAAVVGIEIEVTRLVGKWKLSQNQPERNRAGVVEGLRKDGAADLTGWMG